MIYSFFVVYFCKVLVYVIIETFNKVLFNLHSKHYLFLLHVFSADK